MTAHQFDFETDDRPSLWDRICRRGRGAEGQSTDEEPEPGAPQAARGTALRLDAVGGVRVAVRMTPSEFPDVRPAADGLKNGLQQIVNLEKASAQNAERMLDFLNGVTYAIDGHVERVGERVFLFAPANVHIERDTDPPDQD